MNKKIIAYAFALLLGGCGAGSFYQKHWADYYGEHGKCEQLCKETWNNACRAKRIDSTTCECIHDLNPIEQRMLWKPDMTATLTCSRSCDLWGDPKDKILDPIMGKQVATVEVHRTPPPQL